jgi:tRNA threonylcarbamoyl adenosine modification protein YjeE
MNIQLLSLLTTPEQSFQGLSLEDTRKLAHALAHQLENPSLCLCFGQMGSGKTTFIRFFCEGLGLLHPWDVDSPTYTIVNHYRFHAGLIHHYDCFRLTAPEDLESVGLLDQLGEAQWTLVEWPELLATHVQLPDHLSLTFEIDAEELRTIRIVSRKSH